MNFHALWEIGAGLLNDSTRLLDGGNDIGTRTLFYLQHDGGLAVDPGKAQRVLETRVQGSDVGEGNHGVTLDLDRHVEHVVQIFNDARHLD